MSILDREKVWQAYTKIRRKFPNDDIDGHNFEGCPMITEFGYYSRTNSKGEVLKMTEDRVCLVIDGKETFYKC